MKDNEYKEPKKFDREDPEAAAPVEEPPIQDETYRVANCAKVYIRNHPRPGVPSDVIGTLSKDEIVHVDPKFVNDDFKKIVKDGVLVGYVAADYLEKI